MRRHHGPAIGFGCGRISGSSRCQDITAGTVNGQRVLVCVDYAADDHRKHFDFLADGLPKILTKRGRGESGRQTVMLPCIHMPQLISRLTLIVTATKIERLQAISKADVLTFAVHKQNIDALPKEIAA